MNKAIIYLSAFALTAAIFTACKKDEDNGKKGLPEFDNYYYAGFLPWNNTGTESVLRTQTKLVKFPVQFNSAFVRDFDAAAFYTLVTTGITNPAVAGQDFNIVDKNGNTITAANAIYSLNFPQAKKTVDTIYIKVLNSPVAGTRKIEIDLVKNANDKYTVGTFSQSYIRFLEIK
ncbi:hypothetical protein HDE68_004881 [Pedobacter cryoconitis]|uniref:DUF4843 domain-containing protein n=1 Tax=Pedobacter cryoconitis TaxID=188932 RepID=A0A7W8ZRL5_9SPHI|nr:hypothetical protein [Pedobacter cryoconitis]MBB5638943.1 hypothetical protein [Pedobacter cryoconitis]